MPARLDKLKSRDNIDAVLALAMAVESAGMRQPAARELDYREAVLACAEKVRERPCRAIPGVPRPASGSMTNHDPTDAEIDATIGRVNALAMAALTDHPQRERIREMLEQGGWLCCRRDEPDHSELFIGRLDDPGLRPEDAEPVEIVPRVRLPPRRISSARGQSCRESRDGTGSLYTKTDGNGRETGTATGARMAGRSNAASAPSATPATAPDSPARWPRPSCDASSPKRAPSALPASG